MDKSAVGWEHVEKVDKHNSQRGGKRKIMIVSIESCLVVVCVKEFDIMSCPCQITRTASEASSEFRVTGKINLPWVGTIRRRSRSTTVRKVEEETS